MDVLPEEIIIEILLNLKYWHLYDACIAIPIVARICRSDNFWKQKLRHDYNVNVVENAKQQYMLLTNIHMDYRIYQLGRVNSFQVWSDPNKEDHYDTIELRFDESRLRISVSACCCDDNWIESQYYSDPSSAIMQLVGERVVSITREKNVCYFWSLSSPQGYFPSQRINIVYGDGMIMTLYHFNSSDGDYSGIFELRIG